MTQNKIMLQYNERREHSDREDDYVREYDQSSLGKSNIISSSERCPVPPLCLVPPCKFGKILVVDNFVEKNYIENFRIRNYFKKDFLNFSFHYVRYCNHLVTFSEKISHQFSFFQALNEVNQSNIFLVFC